MTLRFSLNNYYAGINSISYYLYDIYRFMTAASPTGPGWTTIGESNGTVGGMGTTGIITSFSSLLSTNAWFVLRSPDSKIQILFGRGNATANNASSYLTYEQFTGGSASSIPTYNTNSTMVITANAKISGTASNYVNHLVANDEFPYNFYAAAVVITGTNVCSAFTSFFNLDGYDSNDGYPFIYMWSNSNGPLTNYIDIESQAYGTRSFLPDGSRVIYSSPATLYANTTAIIPNAGPPGIVDGSQLITFPCIFLGSFLYKGFNNSWLKWCSNSVLAQHDTVQNKEWIRLGDFIFKWDGVTIPRSV